VDDWLIFWKPYLTGLAFSIQLALIGLYLQLRREWLAALAYGQVGAAGALLAQVMAWPLALGGLLFSAGAAVAKTLLARPLGAGVMFVLLLLLGWSACLLLTANLSVAERLGQAMFAGQLYFAGTTELLLALLLLLGTLGYLRFFGPSLLQSFLYPGLPCNQSRRWVRCFDLCAALVLAAAVMSMGVMGVFALAFVPSWSAFRCAGSWRLACRQSVVLGIGAYSLSFFLAWYWDQPYGPMLVACLLFFGVARVLGLGWKTHCEQMRRRGGI